MFRPRTQLWRALLRRICVGFMLAAYLLTVTGFPVLASTRKQGTVPFPCQGHDCGCASAEQCWTNCCCFSPEQHLRWAKEHNFVPPAYANLAIEPDEHTGTESHGCSHCHEDEPLSQASGMLRCDHDDHDDAGGCCRSHGQANAQASQPVTVRVRWVLSLNTLRCRGTSTQWVASGSVAPPPPILSWSAWTPITGSVPQIHSCALLRPALPVDPPPRSGKPV
jgi:hypothetical protein